MKSESIIPVFVNFIPETLDSGYLYICEQYHTVVHKCCCGCGNEVVTPLTPADWSLYKSGKAVTLTPSIGNWSFPCKSHYFIKKNKVVWSYAMSQQEIDRVRTNDQAAKQAYINKINRQKGESTTIGSIITDMFKYLWNLLFYRK